MQVISSVPFSHLKNAEHVSFLTNVGIAIAKITPEAVGLTSALVKQYNDAVALEQDIVNHSTGSVYTPEMRALDDERDRLFKLIRLKLQTILLESADSELAQYSNTVEMLILKKYGLEVAAAPYQEESSLIKGFLLDVRNFLNEETIEALGITADLTALETANNNFADQYNERVTEKSTSISAYGKKVRADAEALYNKNAGFGDMPGYHFYVRRDGHLYYCRPITMKGCHVKGYNTISIGVCSEGGHRDGPEQIPVGNLNDLEKLQEGGNPPPLGGDKRGASAYEDNRTAEQLVVLHELLTCLHEMFPSAKILGHRDLPGVKKACPCYDAAKEYAYIYDH